MARRRPEARTAHEAQDLTLTLVDPASGGTCVAHHENAEGQRTTFFVGGGLPGEKVRVRTTGSAQGGRIGFAEVVEVLEASADRVAPPCPVAGQCGGCDLQHVEISAQLRWKAQVLSEQLHRIGGLREIGDRAVSEVVSVESIGAPLGWRTRVAVDADDGGHPGFHAHRSSKVIAVGHCPVVVPELQQVFGAKFPAGARIHVSTGDIPTMWSEADADVVPGWRRRAWVTRHALGRPWRVATDGFWQAHSAAPELLEGEVVRLAQLGSKEMALDLYSGVGLFAAALSLSTQPNASVIAVEGDPGASRMARRNLHDLPSVSVVHADVRRYDFGSPVAVTVLDPPRSGAGSKVIDAVAAVTQRAIVHVGCDGAATARDVGRLVAAGWQLVELRAFDLFPMTHHVETVALLRR